jgi:hypothetical protein
VKPKETLHALVPLGDDLGDRDLDQLLRSGLCGLQENSHSIILKVYLTMSTHRSSTQSKPEAALTAPHVTMMYAVYLPKQRAVHPYPPTL